MDNNHTQFFKVVKEPELDVYHILKEVYEALTEKGYNPVNHSGHNPRLALVAVLNRLRFGRIRTFGVTGCLQTFAAHSW